MSSYSSLAGIQSPTLAIHHPALSKGWRIFKPQSPSNKSVTRAPIVSMATSTDNYLPTGYYESVGNMESCKPVPKPTSLMDSAPGT